MSNDSDAEKIIAGKPIHREGIQDMLHKVPNSPFVDFRPHEMTEREVMNVVMGPMAGIAGKIDAELAKLSSRIAKLETRSPFKSCSDIET